MTELLSLVSAGSGSAAHTGEGFRTRTTWRPCCGQRHFLGPTPKCLAPGLWVAPMDSWV